MKQIREWLASAGQNYAQGVALYAAHGSSKVVLRTLEFGASEFTRLKLRKELEKLAIAGDVTAPVTAKPVRVVDTSAQRVHETPAASSEALKAERRGWFAERNHLHPQLEACATDAERLVMSLRILELGQLLDQSYAAMPAVDTTQTPSAHLSDISDAGELRRLLANLRPQRTKLKKRPERAADLAQVEADIHLLEEKLNCDGREPQLHPRHRNGT